MKYLFLLLSILLLESCKKNTPKTTRYYPPVKIDSVGLISLTSAPISSMDSITSPYNSIANFTFSTGLLYIDSIPSNTILNQYNWTANDPFTIKYIGAEDLFSPDSLKSRQNTTLLFSINKNLKGKELFQIYVDSTHLFNRIFAPVDKEVKIQLIAISYYRNYISTDSIEIGFLNYLQNNRLSNVHYAIN